jgi:hypothetical protein
MKKIIAINIELRARSVKKRTTCDRLFIPWFISIKGAKKLKRKSSSLIIIVLMIIVLVGSVTVYLLYFAASSIVKPCPNSFNAGHYSEYGGGGSTDCQFEISRNGILTGAFHSNASLDFFIQTADEFTQTPVGSASTMYYYALRNTSSTSLNVSLPTGSYYIDLFFTYSYLGPSFVNGTGYYGSTGLNITQTFVVKLQ